MTADTPNVVSQHNVKMDYCGVFWLISPTVPYLTRSLIPLTFRNWIVLVMTFSPTGWNRHSENVRFVFESFNQQTGLPFLSQITLFLVSTSYTNTQQTRCLYPKYTHTLRYRQQGITKVKRETSYTTNLKYFHTLNIHQCKNRKCPLTNPRTEMQST